MSAERPPRMAIPRRYARRSCNTPHRICIAAIDVLVANLPVLANCGSLPVIVRRSGFCTHLTWARNSNIVDFLEMTLYEMVEVQLFLQSEGELGSASDVHPVS